MGNGIETKRVVRKIVAADRLDELLIQMKADGVTLNRLAFLCIGTDRSSGDTLGPLAGTLLEERGYTRVIGTLKRPCDADSWEERLAELRLMQAEEGAVVLAIDACLGNSVSVGLFQTAAGPLEAGRSLKRGLEPVGDYAIAAIVNVNRGNPVRVLETTAFGRVWDMTLQIVAAVERVFPVTVI
jgi:putative sporulation protein YyaC